MIDSTIDGDGEPRAAAKQLGFVAGALEAVVFPDLRAAFLLVGHRVEGPVGVVSCRAVAAREVVDAVGGWAVGTA